MRKKFGNWNKAEIKSQINLEMLPWQLTEISVSTKITKTKNEIKILYT